ncbi:MAG TPA: hypothetical protein VMH39_01605 [Gemmatimonadaceae bacterium]|nr:hypothetical protein [Gemmatimonadaceae bacterium]
MNSFDHPNAPVPPLERLLRAQRADAFEPGFPDRVLARLAGRPVITLGKSMQRYFAWMTPALIAAILVLAFLNMRAAGRASVGAAFGLPQVTLATAYALEASMGAPQ